jgi:hypothetical protein
VRTLPQNHRLKIYQINEESEAKNATYQINTTGRFLLYSIASLFLIADYDTSLELANCDFSHVDSSSLFQANILRLKALILEQLFQKTRRVEQMVHAIEVLKVSVQLFSKDSQID